MAASLLLLPFTPPLPSCSEITSWGHSEDTGRAAASRGERARTGSWRTRLGGNEDKALPFPEPTRRVAVWLLSHCRLRAQGGAGESSHFCARRLRLVFIFSL